MSLLWHVKVRACSFGFGKILLHKEWKNIDWRISLIPFGGYCDIEEGLNLPNSLYSITYYKQLSIILAGVGINFLISCICYLINYGSIKTGIIIDLYLLKMIIFKNYNLVCPINLDFMRINLFLLECGFMNLILAISNLIPLPALDGGYIWLLLLRKKMTNKVYKWVIICGFVFIIILQLVLFVYIYLKN
jgi:membrane-associated protease RseP (regulator of RpoE activity)